MSEAVDPRAVSVSVLKGGVGKSTIAINLTRELAERGHNALLVDLDPNGHATMGLGLTEEYKRDTHLGDVILDDRTATPEDIIVETQFGFDVLPSSESLERVERELSNVMRGSSRVRKFVINPLLGERYDYIVTDSPANRGRLSDNALVGTLNMIIPLIPGNESLGGLQRTIERQIKPLREYEDLEILSIVPNMLEDRIDQQTGDRILLEELNARESLQKYVPPFATFTQEEFAAIDTGELRPLPKPGIRDRKAFTKGIGENKPLRDFDPENDQLKHFDELAKIVEQGGIHR